MGKVIPTNSHLNDVRIANSHEIRVVYDIDGRLKSKQIVQMVCKLASNFG